MLAAHSVCACCSLTTTCAPHAENKLIFFHSFFSLSLSSSQSFSFCLLFYGFWVAGSGCRVERTVQSTNCVQMRQPGRFILSFSIIIFSVSFLLSVVQFVCISTRSHQCCVRWSRASELMFQMGKRQTRTGVRERSHGKKNAVHVKRAFSSPLSEFLLCYKLRVNKMFHIFNWFSLKLIKKRVLSASTHTEQ